MSEKLLVTGASGHLGQRVIELLLESGADSIIATTRNPEKLAHFANRGVIVRYANFDEPQSLVSAFAGANRMLLISTDALDEVGKRLKQHQIAVKAGKEAGVSHIIYTSLISADDSPVLFAPDHAGTEQAIIESGVGYTILRNNLYMDLLVQSIPQAYQMNGLYGATADGKTAYITREDCAKVAAAALSASFDGNRILNITGAEAVSQADIAQIATHLTGKSLAYHPIPLEALIQGMTGAGLPLPVAEAYASIDIAIAQGKMGIVSSDFTTLTGHTPTSISDFLKTHLS